MKLAVFGVLAYSLILANAAYLDPIEVNMKILGEYAQSLTEKSDQVTKEIERKYDEIIVQPMEHVQESVDEIEDRKKESQQCVDQQWAGVENVVENLESTINSCTQTAAASSLTVAVNIAETSLKLGSETFSLLKSIQRCRRYKNSILRKSCYATQLVKVTNLIAKTRKAIKALNKTVDETLPQIFFDLESCSAAAEESALAELESINRNIDRCVAI